MPHPNARFWAYLNGGPVTITLRPGQRQRRGGGSIADFVT